MSDRGYSLDLRERVVDAYEKLNVSMEEIGLRYKVSKGTVQNWLKLKKETGKVDPRPHGGGFEAEIDERAVNLLKAWLSENSDFTLKELSDRLTTAGYVAYEMSVSRALDRAGITRKKSRSTLRSSPALTLRRLGPSGQDR